MTARDLIAHCRERAAKLHAEIAACREQIERGELQGWPANPDPYRAEAAELNRAANEAEGRLGGYPFDGRDPGALRLIEMEELLALPGGDYDACDAQYRANYTRAARVLRRELAICKESETCQSD